MRWSQLFDDLEAQMTRAERDEFESDVAERSRAERAAISLGAVLAASRGDHVRVVLTDGSAVDGQAVDAAAQWLHLRAGMRDVLVPATAIAQLEGERTAAPEPGVVQRRLSLGHVLRALEAGRIDVTVSIAGDSVRGRIVGVGADYLVLAREAGRSATVVPFAAVARVTSGAS